MIGPNLENLSDEDYVLQRAKNLLLTDPITAKAWMVTAKTLYPTHFSVQFEAYIVEKNARNVKEAAKTLSEIIGKFDQNHELWVEIDAMTAALRADPETLDPAQKFFSDIFQQITPEIQHQILLITADRCQDTMEHCKLLLLLLQKFPKAISIHASKLVDTLITAEKHLNGGLNPSPINPFRKLLVHDLLNLLGMCGGDVLHTEIDLPPKLIYKLINRAIEYYFCILSNGAHQEGDQLMEQPWSKLFKVLEMSGKILGWDHGLISFGNSWNKEAYWHKLSTFFKMNSTKFNDENILKQFSYALTIYFLYCLHEYSNISQNSGSFVLLEAFIDPTLPRTNTIESLKTGSGSQSKRKKVEMEMIVKDDNDSAATITIDQTQSPAIQSVIINFIHACKCWELIHLNELIQRQSFKISSTLKLDLDNFILDFAIYKGHYEDAIVRLQEPSSTILSPPAHDPHIIHLIKTLRLASIAFFQGQYAKSYDFVYAIVSSLTRTNMGTYSQNLTIGGHQRHLHFVPITHLAILQYCVRLIIAGIKASINKAMNGFTDLALGCLLVLIQLDWPQLDEILPIITTTITQRGTFHFPLLQKYVVNVELLEELMYLWTDQGGKAQLDIFLTTQSQLGNVRRIGTRGADKGVKEDFKHAMRRQVIRSNDPIDQVVTNFVLGERVHIAQCLN